MAREDIPYEVPPEERRRHIIPPREQPADDNGYFEVLSQAVFMAGFNWQLVYHKWPAFRQAFDGFDVDRVAAYRYEDVERLLKDPAIIRNGRKIEAVVENARAVQGIVAEHGSFHAFLRSLDGLPYRVRNEAVAAPFKWLGRTGAYTFLWCVGEDVPRWEER